MSETRKLFESFQNNLNEEKLDESTLNEAKVDLSKLTNELEAEMKKYMTEPEIGFDAERNPNDRYNMYYGDYLIRANAELGYDSLTGLADRLDKIISKYDKEAYFEPEDSGRLVCLLSKKLIKESTLKEDDSFYNELEVIKYRPTGQDEGALANMTIKSKFGELNVNLLNIDGEYKIVTPNMFRTKEEEELINNLVDEYGMQGLTDFAADYYYKQTYMNESTLNEDKPDFIVFTNDKLTDYDANIKKLNSRIRRMKTLSKYHPEYKEQVDKLRKELKQTKQDRESYTNSEEFKDEKEKYFNSTNESALNEKSTEKDIANIHANLENSNSFDEIQNVVDYIKDNELRKEVQISLDDCKNRNYNLEDTKEQVIETLENSAEYTNEGDSLEKVRKDSIEKGLLSEDYNPLNLKLFMNTWGNYNENGADVDSIGGGWMDIEQVKDFLEKHSDEEPFINDVDGWTPFEINEYSNVEQVIEWLEAYENLSENEQEAFAAIMEDQNDDFESTMNILESGDYIFFSGVNNEEDLGRAWVDMVGGIEGVSNPENYVDEDAYRESWRDAAEEDVRNENPDIDEDSDEFESLVQNWLDNVVDEQLQLDIDEGRDLSEYFDYEAFGRDLYNNGFYFADAGAIQIL